MRRIVYLITAVLVYVVFVAGACGGKIYTEPNDPPQVDNPSQGGNGDDEGEDEGDGGNGGTQGGVEARDGEFVILFTNDFHSQIDPLGKDETYNADRGGVKRIKALVDSVRQAEPAVLLADAGDFVQGTYYFSLLNGVVEMMVMNQLEYPHHRQPRV